MQRAPCALSIDGNSCSLSSAPTIRSRVRYHLKWNSRPVCPRQAVLYPLSKTQRTLFRSLGGDVVPTVRRPASTSPSPHQHIDSTVWSKQRLALIYPVSPSSLTAPTDSWIVRPTMAGPAPRAELDLRREAALLLLQTTTHVEISGIAS